MGRLNRNLYAMLQFIEQPKTLGLTSKKTLLSLKGISCLQVILCWSGWNECWYGSIYKEMELETDCLTSTRLLQNVCGYKCQFCTNVWASCNLQGWSLKFICFMMAGQNVKKSTCVRSLSKCWNNMQLQTQVYITWRFIHQKGAEKLVKDEYMYYVATYLANTGVLNIQIFSRRHHIYYWHWRILPSVLQRKWCQDL